MSTTAAHPRSRGENSSAWRICACSSGSSPLTRGKRTLATRGRGLPVAHPRSRGENRLQGGARSGERGSSPLTRGKLAPDERSRDLAGLIPAHAGKTRRATKRAVRSRAHPRSRGENRLVRQRVGLASGSSPLTRGKPSRPSACRSCQRLIPAHAGKTRNVRDRGNRAWAHPRSRGENRLSMTWRSRMTGSSPLTRGKPTVSTWRITVFGLIPAHAGKTPGPRSVTDPHQAHPRSRGENAPPSGVLSTEAGSSPLTRGKPHGSSLTQPHRRLIPAHAGKTPSRRAPCHGGRAHPRSRGENLP